MGYFANGWPKTYLLPECHITHSTPQHDPVQQLLPDPSDRYLLTFTHAAIYIWNACQHRILLARFRLPPSIIGHEGPFVAAAWSPTSSRIIAALKNGLLLLLHVTPIPDSLALNFRPRDDSLIQPQPFPALRITREAQLRVAHASACVTAITACPAGALVATSTATITCVAWDGDMLWRAHLPELLRNNNAITKMGITMSGPDSHPVLASLQSDDESQDNLGGIVALAYNRELGFCGVVCGHGPALLLGLHSAGCTRPSAIDGRWLRTTRAVSIALEPRRMLATVGLADGDVEHYYVGVPAGDRCPVMRRLSLSHWYFEPADVGAATVLRWSQDGAALVVGWEKKGLAIWSVSGCRLMWTLPQIGGTLPTTPALRNRDAKGTSVIHPMEQGVLAAAWGPKGLYLWAVPNCSEESPSLVRDCHFVEFSLYKGSSGGSLSQSNSSRLALYGTDRLLLLSHAGGVKESHRHASGASSKDLFSWQHLMIPQEYLWKNWPPTRVAINADVSYAAVAGKYGVAICQIRLQRWKVFGDLEHDRRIRCCSLAWIGKTLIIGNEIEGTRGGDEASTFELLFYFRDQIEASALQAHRKLPSRPLMTDVRADGYLLVMCENAQVFLFKVTDNYSRSRIDLREVYRLLLPTREVTPMYQQDKPTRTASGERKSVDDLPPPAPGGGISEARIFPPLSHTDSSNSLESQVPTHIMLLRSTGSLILLDTDRMVSTALLRYVERFWYTPTDCTPFDLISPRPVWWAYGDDGLHVCFQDGIPRRTRLAFNHDLVEGLSPTMQRMSSRKKAVDVEQWFELDPEVYPLSIMSKYGMLLGASQGLMTSNIEVEGGSMPCHVIQVKRQPILHTLLRHLLMKPMSDERTALQVALKCVSQPQFIESLEWLLYEAVLEHDDDSTTINMNGISPQSGNVSNSGMYQGISESPAKNLTGAQGFPESPRRKKAGGNLFPRVIRLLKYFGEYEDVVVRCARKLENKRWPLLFSLAGEPAALLEQCFVSGRLKTAACLLVILQEMWGFISSTPHSLRLVEAALAKGELGLAADLANFLSKADRAGMLNSSQLRTTEDVSWIAEAARTPRGDLLERITERRLSGAESWNRIPAVDLAVLNHARFLLNKMDLRKLAALSVRMDFPLSEWLRRELKGKNVNRPFVRDFGTTILSLHRQFQFPEPSLQDVRRAMRSFNSETEQARGRGVSVEDLAKLTESWNGIYVHDERLPDMTPRSFASNANVDLVGPGAESVFGSQLPPPPSCNDSQLLVAIRAKGRELCNRELAYLMTVGRAARTPDLILCCATLLLDIAVIRMVLRGHEELLEPYMAALSEFNVPGYDALVAVLNEIATPKS